MMNAPHCSVKSCQQLAYDFYADKPDTWHPDQSWLFRISDDLSPRKRKDKTVTGFSRPEGNEMVTVSDSFPHRDAPSRNAAAIPQTADLLDPRCKEVLLSRLGATLFENSLGYSLIAPAQLVTLLTETTHFNQLFYHYILNTFIAIEVEIRPFQPEHTYTLYSDLQRLNEIKQGGSAIPAIGISIQVGQNTIETQYLLATSKRNTLECVYNYDTYSIPLKPAAEHLPAAELINMIAIQAISQFHNTGNCYYPGGL